MSYLPTRVFAFATMASGSTLSTYINVSVSYNKILLEVPTMTSGTNIYMQGAVSASGTFRRIMNPSTNVTGVAPSYFNIASSVTGGNFVEVPFVLPYMKVELTTAMTDTTSNFNLVCMQ
jgi:hypothetical protein